MPHPFRSLFWVLLLLIITLGCSHKPIKPSVVPAECPPVILVPPSAPPKPDVSLKYKVENGKEWFALDRNGYITIRNYIIGLEGALEFVNSEISTSNKQQNEKVK